MWVTKDLISRTKSLRNSIESCKSTTIWRPPTHSEPIKQLKKSITTFRNLRSLLSEWQMESSKLPLLPPVIQSVLNHLPSPSRANYASLLSLPWTHRLQHVPKMPPALRIPSILLVLPTWPADILRRVYSEPSTVGCTMSLLFRSTADVDHTACLFPWPWQASKSINQSASWNDLLEVFWIILKHGQKIVSMGATSQSNVVDSSCGLNTLARIGMKHHELN